MSARYDRTGVKKIVVHHLGDGQAAAKSSGELWRRGNPFGYEFPEYDFGVLEDGTIIEMRPLSVIGAHAQAMGDSFNYWNKNSASIVLGIDTQKYFPSPDMFEGVTAFLAKWLKAGGKMYPHYAITQTYCPGKAIYTAIEKEVDIKLKGVGKVHIVYYYGPDDIVLARRVALKVGGVIADRGFNSETVQIAKIYSVGGPEIPGAVNLTGRLWEDTAEAVINFIREG